MGGYFISCRNCQHPLSTYLISETSVNNVCKSGCCPKSEYIPIMTTCKDLETANIDAHTEAEECKEPQEIDFCLTTGINNDDSSNNLSIPGALLTVDINGLSPI